MPNTILNSSICTSGYLGIAWFADMTGQIIGTEIRFGFSDLRPQFTSIPKSAYQGFAQ